MRNLLFILLLPLLVTSQEVAIKFICFDNISEKIDIYNPIFKKGYEKYDLYKVKDADSVFISNLNDNPCIDTAFIISEGWIKYHTDDYFNDTKYNDSWHLMDDELGNPVSTNTELGFGLEFETVWDVINWDTTFVVGIPDEGIDTSHRDLKRSKKGVYNSYPEDLDEGDHGSWVTGVMFAENNNSVDASSAIGGDGNGTPKFIFGKISKGDGIVYTLELLKALIYLVDNGMIMTNNSYHFNLGTAKNEQVREIHDDWFTKEGTKYMRRGPNHYSRLLICSAGNQGYLYDSNWVYYPRNWEVVTGFKYPMMTVAGSDFFGKLAAESTRHNYVDIMAPYSYINTTAHASTGTVMLSGTSFSAPMVSGIAALLMMQYNGYFTPEDIIYLIKEGAQNVDSKNTEWWIQGKYGTGVANAPGAFEEAEKLIKKRNLMF